MPELPEVEVTRRSIDAPLRGALVRSVRVGKPLRWPLGRDAAQLRGLAVGAVQRRGKYLWLPLLHGQPPGAGRHADAQGLLLHLGMSGSLALLAAPGPPGPHDHFDLETDRGTLRLTDPRRFGAVVWSAGLTRDPAARLLRTLGAEPFDAALTPAAFHAALACRSGAIKTVLLGGGIVVGAGNIYACEALFDAGIDPRLPAMRLSRPRAERLLGALRETLARAIEQGGSSLRDFRDAHGTSGTFQTQTAVYARAGQPCRRCATAVRRIVQAQRATYFCPRCQRR